MEEYLNLRKKVDEQFDKIFNKYRSQMSCTEGCHDCCVPDLSVTQVEAEMIKAFLKSNPLLIDQLKQLLQTNPYQGTRCALLNEQGQCSIYEVRPLICRSHGAPVLVQIDDTHEGIDACPKNFSSGLSVLEAGDWIHLDTLNTLIALVDWRNALDQGRERPDPELDRVTLKIESLLP